MVSQTTLIDSNSRPKPIPPDAVWDRVDPLAADCGASPTTTGLAELPYFMLQGPGFERLVYELLQAENQRPWFFGRAGQADYGVDIVAEVAGRQTIYQCKNYTEAPSFRKVRDAVAKFESEWLTDMNLPAPEAFVYCCPQPLDDSSFAVEWIKFKTAFHKRTGVTLSFLDRRALDTKLRSLPDVVAGLFSDSYAEHFCGRDGWRDDPWFRLQHGAARFLGINRFLERHERNAIYVVESHKQLFLAALDQSSVVALRGLPGTGKSFLALELACGLRQPLRRIYYATFKDNASAEQLWQSARRRLSLPALFVLDDCHLAPEEAGNLLERLNPELLSGKLKLAIILRDQVSGDDVSGIADRPDDTPAWLIRLKEQGALIELRADAERTLAVTGHLRPVFSKLSRSRLDRLHNSCGGDLLLLDEILQTLPAPQDIDTLDVNSVLPTVRAHYFGGNRRMSTLTKLAALAQFDLLPRADFFEGQWRQGEEESADPLMTRLFAPERYQFLHSSLAALVLRALTQLDVSDDILEDTTATITTGTLRNYLLHLGELPRGSVELHLAIQQSLSARLRLLNSLKEARIKSAVLADAAIEGVIQAELGSLDFAVLGKCVHWLAMAEHPAMARYVGMMERRFRILFEKSSSGSDSSGGKTIGSGMKSLQRHAPDKWHALLQGYGAEPFARVILANVVLPDLFKILTDATPEFRGALLELLTSAQATTLIEKTIAVGRSIGTLHLAMRELHEAEPELLARLERAVGAANLLRLILANGTLFELFKILEYASTEFGGALLGQLTSAQAAALLDKTVVAGRSIGTLDLAMRKLGDADPELLARLERAIGAHNFLRLILANGTLFELFHVLGYATSEFRGALLGQLTSAQATALLEKTIVAGRSIGTLHLAMRKLGDADPELLARLERAIGAHNFLRLILANGTVFELFMVLKHSTTKFRAALLKQLTMAQAATLLEKTIIAERSIGTLDLAMRELGDGDPQLLTQLEKSLGTPGFLRLIVANGTLSEFFNVLEHGTTEFRAALLGQLTPAQAAKLLEKTIARARRIESFHFTLRSLSTSLDQLTKLENVLGVEAWWRLLIARGSLNSISQISKVMSSGFRPRIIAAAATLSVADWRGIIDRSYFQNACEFAKNDLPSLPRAARDAFRYALMETAESLAGRATWSDLNFSRPPTEPQNAEGAILRAALGKRMEAVQINNLFDLGFAEAAAAFSCCWRERPNLRSELIANLHHTLPSREDWPRKKGEVTAVSSILSLARDTEFPESEGQWLSNEVLTFLDRQICNEITTSALFRVIWNIAALSYERGLERNFGSAFPNTTQEMLLSLLSDRISPKGSNPEKLAQFALAGLIAFLFPQYKTRLVTLLAPLKGAVRWLADIALQQSFVRAVFTLEGIALRTVSESVFSPWVCSMLLLQYGAEEEDGPAARRLRLQVSQKHDHNVHG